jgi:hypothetical protein
MSTSSSVLGLSFSLLGFRLGVLISQHQRAAVTAPAAAIPRCTVGMCQKPATQHLHEHARHLAGKRVTVQMAHDAREHAWQNGYMCALCKETQRSPLENRLRHFCRNGCPVHVLRYEAQGFELGRQGWCCNRFASRVCFQ